MMTFAKVAVLMGGQASEREISLNSGRAITRALVSQGIDATAVDVTSLDDLTEVAKNYDKAFIALHGRWGEDGVVQAVLDDLNLPYTGSGMTASAIAMDKLRTKWMWLGAGLPTPRFIWISKQTPLNLDTFSIPFPVIVKPSHEGSSLGMRKVENISQLSEAVTHAQQYDSEVLVEEWITGREFTCAVLKGKALPLIELKTSHDFYDFEAKYGSDETQYICPCDLDKTLEKRLKQLVLEAFNVIGAKGWGRVDLMLDDENQPWLIELNTVPGMTSHSLVPMAAEAIGCSFEQLVLDILQDT